MKWIKWKRDGRVVPLHPKQLSCLLQWKGVPRPLINTEAHFPATFFFGGKSLSAFLIPARRREAQTVFKSSSREMVLLAWKQRCYFSFPENCSGREKMTPSDFQKILRPEYFPTLIWKKVLSICQFGLNMHMLFLFSFALKIYIYFLFPWKFCRGLESSRSCHFSLVQYITSCQLCSDKV